VGIAPASAEAQISASDVQPRTADDVLILRYKSSSQILGTDEYRRLEE
jgi:hypothetical protein